MVVLAVMVRVTFAGANPGAEAVMVYVPTGSVKS